MKYLARVLPKEPLWHHARWCPRLYPLWIGPQNMEVGSTRLLSGVSPLELAQPRDLFFGFSLKKFVDL